MTVAVAPSVRSRPPRRGWRGPRYEGELPTLGYGVLNWMTTYLPSPRDETQPFIPTDEQAQKILQWYALHPVTGEPIYRRWLQQRSKGWGKSPMAGALEAAELGATRELDSAPVVFDGWDGDGEPVGRPWGTGGLPPAWVQIAAVSEDQTDNTYSALYQMLTANNHRAAIALGIDDGRTRLYLRGRPGKLEPVTASSGSREGQPVTSAVLDETHLFTARNGGVKLARTIRRNAAKMNGRTIETANAPSIGDGSVAEASLKAAQTGAPGVLLDAMRPLIEPDPRWGDEQLLGALREAYGDSWWVDLPRLLREMRDPDMPWEDVLRFFFNIPTTGASHAVDGRQWDGQRRDIEIAEGTLIGIGFDGSTSHDATVLRGCTRPGHSFILGRWSRPPGPGEWRVPRDEVDQVVANAFARYRVGRMLCDPPGWRTEIERWQELYGDGPDGKPIVMALDTNSPRRMVPIVDRWRTGISNGAHTHDGDPFTTEQVKATRLRRVYLADGEDDRTRYMLEKDGHFGNDSAIADALAYEAAMTMLEPEPEPEPAILLGRRR